MNYHLTPIRASSAFHFRTRINLRRKSSSVGHLRFFSSVENHNFKHLEISLNSKYIMTRRKYIQFTDTQTIYQRQYETFFTQIIYNISYIIILRCKEKHVFFVLKSICAWFVGGTSNNFWYLLRRSRFLPFKSDRNSASASFSAWPLSSIISILMRFG